MPERACRNCRFISSSNVCPNCKQSSFSEDWLGELVVVDSENSTIAKNLGIKNPGRYALRVR
ncbi:DNA-directed RNA polymerase, subunit E'' [Candidatus Bathyarchaeota archaeon]|nr:DNA-directed RNA polymerase, subunit E'' [Candidatus Bathyarchaeota archaeon]